MQRNQKRFWGSEQGSASIEFVLLAVPLFLPLFLYLNYFAEASDTQERLRTLARESARAFVTSANDRVAFEVARSVVIQGGEILGFTNAEANLQLDIDCEKSPCISPDNRVIISLRSQISNSQVSVVEYVSPWA
jgi:Flp pilus assembly protein TadG